MKLTTQNKKAVWKIFLMQHFRIDLNHFTQNGLLFQIVHYHGDKILNIIMNKQNNIM